LDGLNWERTCEIFKPLFIIGFEKLKISFIIGFRNRFFLFIDKFPAKIFLPTS
jgi:hypothetical protein